MFKASKKKEKFDFDLTIVNLVNFEKAFESKKIKPDATFGVNTKYTIDMMN